jgi:hypothetical protein
VRAVAQALVKGFHTLAFAAIQTHHLLDMGRPQRADGRPAALAVGIAAAETAIYVGNGFRCPRTGLAERLGAKSGQVTDIFLPKWLANNIANIYCPLFALGLYLHARNLRQRQSGSALAEAET